jgi:hypothetical protein
MIEFLGNELLVAEIDASMMLLWFFPTAASCGLAIQGRLWPASPDVLALI